MGLCNINYIFDDNNFRTLLMTDGTLVINADETTISQLIADHGAITKEYKGGPYTFGSENDQPWKNERTQVKAAIFGTAYQPTSLAHMFSYCYALKTIDKTNLDTSKCTSMERAFSRIGATMLDLSGLDVTKVATLESAFEGCDAFQMNLCGWDTGSCTNFKRAFANCTNLVTVYADETLVLPAGATGPRMFTGSTKITGSMGTAFSSSAEDAQRAFVDKGTSRPGYFSDPAVGVSTLYRDGHLVINERPGDRAANITAHGNVIGQYAAATAANNWAAGWALNPGRTDWNTTIKTAGLGQPMKPGSMEGWFYGLDALTRVDTTGLDTSECTSMAGLFYHCSVLNDVDMSGWDTSKVTTMRSMFHHATAFSTLVDYVNAFDTSNVTELTGWVCGVKALTTFTPKINTSKVTIWSSTFAYMDNLEVLDVSNLDFSAAADCPFMFGMNAKLTTIKVKAGEDLTHVSGPNMFRYDNVLVGGAGTTYSVDNQAYARVDNPPDAPGYFTAVAGKAKYASFDSSTGILRFFEDDEDAWTDGQIDGTKTYWTDVEDMMTPKWTSVRSQITKAVFDTKVSFLTGDQLFAFCSNMTAVENADRLDTSKMTSAAKMFNVCSKLTDLDVSTWDVSKIRDANYMFGSVPAATLDISGWQANSLQNTSFMFYNVRNVTTLDVSGLNMSNVQNPNSMFRQCSALETITGLEGWDTGNFTTTEGMFQTCQALTSASIANIGSWNVSKVTSTSNMFNTAVKITSMDLSSWSTPALLNTSSMFLNCLALTTADLSNFNTSQATNMASMFYGCAKLTSVDLSSFTTDNVQNISYIFENCGYLATIKAGNWDLTTAAASGATRVRGMFAGCTNLVGGAGTTYDSTKTDNTYARIDNPPSAPGYFTAP